MRETIDQLVRIGELFRAKGFGMKAYDVYMDKNGWSQLKEIRRWSDEGGPYFNDSVCEKIQKTIKYFENYLTKAVPVDIEYTSLILSIQGIYRYAQRFHRRGEEKTIDPAPRKKEEKTSTSQKIHKAIETLEAAQNTNEMLKALCGLLSLITSLPEKEVVEALTKKKGEVVEPDHRDVYAEYAEKTRIRLGKRSYFRKISAERFSGNPHEYIMTCCECGSLSPNFDDSRGGRAVPFHVDEATVAQWMQDHIKLHYKESKMREEYEERRYQWSDNYYENKDL